MQEEKAARISAQESKLESHTPMKNGCHLTAVPWSLWSTMVFRKRESRLNIYCTILTPTFGFAGKFHPGLGPKGNRSRKQVTYLIMSWNNGMKKTWALRGGETTRQEIVDISYLLLIVKMQWRWCYGFLFTRMRAKWPLYRICHIWSTCDQEKRAKIIRTITIQNIWLINKAKIFW